MKIPAGILEALMDWAKKIHGPGYRIVFEAGWGCTIFEVYRHGEEDCQAERRIW